ncbi:MAG: hypothetical protein ACLQIB_05800 [Isosphaeraceae bacterium]
MQPTLTPSKTASAIWSRIVQPQRGTLTPEVARAFLKLDFDAADRRRVDLLSSKAAAGALSDEERAELEEYVRVNNELMVLQSKARLSLRGHRTGAKG